MSPRVTVPEGTCGNVEVRRFTIEENDLANIMAIFKGGRQTRPGEYTALYRNGRLWMSDTDAEWRDHWPVIDRLRWDRVRSVLINGLGLGMVVQEALAREHIEQIDVVEIDADVITLVGPHYTRDPRVTIHHADAYEINWPTGTRWEVAWHDIWVDLCTDNLPDMARLHRKYGRRVGWQDSWGRELLRYRRDQERRMGF